MFGFIFVVLRDVFDFQGLPIFAFSRVQVILLQINKEKQTDSGVLIAYNYLVCWSILQLR